MRKPTVLIPSFAFGSLVAVGSLLTFGACTSDPPSPASVRGAITSDLGNVLHEAAAASDGGSSMLPTSSLSVIEKALGHGGGGAAAVARRMLAAPSTPPATGFDPDAIIDQLNTTIFTDANEVEAGIYIVPADLACKQTTIDSSGNQTTTVDPDCAAHWDQLQLRIRVEEDGSTLRFAVQLDAHHDEPLEIALTHTSLSVSVDLDAAERATIAVATALGEQAPNAHLSGKVTGKLTILGTAHAAVSFAIDHAVSIAVAEQGVDLTGADAFRLTSAAAQVFDVDMDGGAGIGSASLGLGATAVHVPGTDTFDLDLPGATAHATLHAGQPLQLDHVGLGDRTTTLSKNGAIGLSIDVNPLDGRAFGATVTRDDTAGTETVAVSPRLDVRIAQDHAVLGGTPPRYDVTRVLLDGSLRSSDASDQVAVLGGTFAITTNPAQYGFSAAAGQCVAGTDTYDPATSDYYTQWTVGVCQ